MTKSVSPLRDIAIQILDPNAKPALLTTPRCFITLCNGDHLAALLFSQCLYWSDRTQDRDGWFSKSFKEWDDELAMSTFQIRRAVNALKIYGLEVKKRRSQHHSGAPTLHYRLNKTVMLDGLKAFAAKSTSRALKEETYYSEQAVSRKTYTEITAEKKEKESPAETTASGATAVLSPVGDARLGDASRSDDEQGQDSFSVKADDAFKLNNLPDREESLPGSRAAILPPAAQTRPARSAAPAQTRPARSAAPAQTRPARSAAPAQTPPAQSAATRAKSDATPPRPDANPMLAAVAYAFKIPQGAYAGKIGQFFAARMPRNRKDPWASHQPQTAATPQEIIGLFLWYSRHLSYVKSCADRGGKLPSTPSILRDRLDEFRDSPTYASAMQAAAPLLEKLMRGESIATPVMPANAKPANAIGAVESAEAYKTYDPKHDPAYQRAVDRDAAAAAFEQMFGR